MTPDALAEKIRCALVDLVSAGRLDLDVEAIPSPVKVERPRSREHGDWATNVALQLGKRAGTTPRDLAAMIAEAIGDDEGIDAVEVAGPGFLNITLSAASAGELARTILDTGPQWGRSTALRDLAVNLEFVSANPTGPIHLGGARWAAVGDTLARVMEACGADVTREYYFNDHGSQIDRFSSSLLAAARGEDVPEDGYGGDYIGEIAQQVRDDEVAAGRPDPVDLDDAQAQEVFRARGVELMFAQIKDKLVEFGVNFDVFFHEETLHRSGAVDRSIQRLRDAGAVYEADGAVWLRTSQFADDKDRVLIKSDGEAAYFAADTAYYLDKRERGADCCIYLLGADHHGYIGRMMAMCEAYGDKAGDNMQIIIGQLVNLVKDGKPVRMSKRAGNVVTLDDLVDAVGVDAARYALVRSSMDQALDIDLDQLASHSNDNPVYYVQYAHARTCSVATNAAEHEVSRDAGFTPAALDTAADSELLGVLARFPAIVAQAGELREPHRVAHYLEDVAAAYHAWYAKCRVTPRAGEEVNAGHVARLWLNDAVRQVLANGLNLLGVSAPEKM
ncbi:arginine--tRNA ligase [Nanchangia anserum]|uniref:Arginine--tRNA ligase n=1 Tax=Nanchangia anserum TaxID=2692125 RepID=A0A8I0GFT8_9ACTO|nr:arginine--tRNA ligase [Nanchangia anserum]MBD3690042.1 arginine--tRNA ligase [Nanchangia anserum]QOX82162.1 arginine--tRNA ligase [Nanchangia anserum]